MIIMLFYKKQSKDVYILRHKKIMKKAQNIISLYNSSFHVPKTYILQKECITDMSLNKVRIKWKIILRPSFKNEDSSDKTLAWRYNSIILENSKELTNFIENNYWELWVKFWWDNKTLLSIIIQDFIESEIYWVAFTRDPHCFLQKWFYEIWTNYDSITSGRSEKNKQMSFLKAKELEHICYKIESIFQYPQDIEFSIQKWRIILLQTRDITSWNCKIQTFKEIRKKNWIYKYIDFDELWAEQDTFSYEVLNKIFDVIHINKKIYFKKSIFLFRKEQNTHNTNLELFLKHYKLYIKHKLWFNVLKKISFQKLDKNMLKNLFKNYRYSFLLEKKSCLGLKLKYKKINYLSQKFLNLEKKKIKLFVT